MEGEKGGSLRLVIVAVCDSYLMCCHVAWWPGGGGGGIWYKYTENSALSPS